MNVRPRSAIVVVAMFSTLITRVTGAPTPPTGHSLFVLERDQNANRLNYEALLVGDAFHPRSPIRASWVMLAEDGHIEELTMFERMKAYGVELIERSATQVVFVVKALPGLPIIARVDRASIKPVALMRLLGNEFILRRVFLHTSGVGPVRNVKSIDLYCEKPPAEELVRIVLEREGNRWRERLDSIKPD